MDFLYAKIPNYYSPLSNVPIMICTKRIPSDVYFVSNLIESFSPNTAEPIMSVQNLTSLISTCVYHSPPLQTSTAFELLLLLLGHQEASVVGREGVWVQK